ncbi:Sorting nexin-16 [Gossypium australe]|uniref:Sorting nexin-16 n=1 Tax=Gossypium australe TaxID=47621 RepID=A0A5B6U9R5_9ROSI|nr:Sorting nexin-16 [Gossypium australe]
MAKTTKRLIFLSDGAPTALVSLIGHKQYRRCARDIYFFTQFSLSCGILWWIFMERNIIKLHRKLRFLFL